LSDPARHGFGFTVGIGVAGADVAVTVAVEIAAVADGDGDATLCGPLQETMSVSPRAQSELFIDAHRGG
jgi:hypothetical protein